MFSFEVTFNFETDDIKANLGSESLSTFCQSKIRQNFFKSHCHAIFQFAAAEGVMNNIFVYFSCFSHLNLGRLYSQQKLIIRLYNETFFTFTVIRSLSARNSNGLSFTQFVCFINIMHLFLRTILAIITQSLGSCQQSGVALKTESHFILVFCLLYVAEYISKV